MTHGVLRTIIFTSDMTKASTPHYQAIYSLQREGFAPAKEDTFTSFGILPELFADCNIK
jgi:hypothetical protein